MSMKQGIFRLSTAAAAIAFAASMSTWVSIPALADELPAEVMHFWVSGGESAAIKVMADAYNKRGGKWIDTAIAGDDAEKQAGLSRLQGGNPPTALMWLIGVDAAELAKQGMLNNIDDTAASGNWVKILPPSVLKDITYDGHTVAVPVDIHGENWLFANSKILEIGRAHV